jgi:PEGA domain
MSKSLRLAVFLCACPMLLAQTPDADKARVFITDSQSWSIAGAGGGANGVYGSSVAGGARPQTAEIIKTFGQRCPEVIVNNKQEKANYIVLLDHEGGKGALRHKNKVAVFNRVSGDSIVSKSTLSLGGSVQDACEAITADWSAHGKEIRAAEAQPPVPQPSPGVPAGSAGGMVPATTTDHVAADAPVRRAEAVATATAQLQISSTPDAADIEIDGSFVGNTPSTIGVTAGAHQISVKKSGFKPWERKITVSSGQINLNATLESDTK